MKRYVILIIVILLSISGIFIVWRKQQDTPFLLASEGSAATMWLTDVLNSISDINCTHYLSLNAKKSVRVPQSPSDLPLQAYFKLLKENSRVNRKIYGNIHGYTVGTILSKNPSAKIRIANLIRHPVSQINSMHKFWLRTPNMSSLVENFMIQKDQNRKFPASTDHYIPSFNEALEYAHLLKAHGYTFPDNVDSWTFLTILGRYNRVHNEMLLAEQKSIPQFKFEEYTTREDVLSDLILHISNNKLILNPAQIAALIQKPATNINNTVSLEPAQIYANWAPWQKYAFALHLQQIGGSENNAYVRQGYDLSFVAL